MLGRVIWKLVLALSVALAIALIVMNVRTWRSDLVISAAGSGTYRELRLGHGRVGVTLIHVTTKSWFGQSSQVNQLGGGDSDQAVNVSAVDFFKSLTVAGGAAGGFVGVAGGIDIGVADSSVQAFIQGLANVSANGAVDR